MQCSVCSVLLDPLSTSGFGCTKDWEYHGQHTVEAGAAQLCWSWYSQAEGVPGQSGKKAQRTSPTYKQEMVVKGSLLCKSSVMLSTKVLWVPKCLCQAEEEAWFVCARAGVALCVCALYRSVS